MCCYRCQLQGVGVNELSDWRRVNCLCVVTVASYKEFEELIYRWRLRAGETQDDYPWKVSDSDLASHKEKVSITVL